MKLTTMLELRSLDVEVIRRTSLFPEVFQEGQTVIMLNIRRRKSGGMQSAGMRSRHFRLPPPLNQPGYAKHRGVAVLYVELYPRLGFHHAGEDSRYLAALDIAVGVVVVRGIDSLQDTGAIELVDCLRLRVVCRYIGDNAGETTLMCHLSSYSKKTRLN